MTRTGINAGRATFVATLALAGGAASQSALTVPASAAAPSVFLNTQYASQAERPEAFGPDEGPGPYIEARTYARAIHWISWGGPEATGVGQVMLLTGTATSPVTITLGGLTNCGGQLIYTTYAMALAPGVPKPRYWAQGQAGRFPCHITAAYFSPHDRGEQAAAVRGDCTFSGLVKLGSYAEPVSWMPPPPRGGRYVGLCRMAWRSWGGPTASVIGIMRNGFRQWAATAEVGELAWCPDQALAYTALTMTLYGRGERIPPRRGSVTKQEAQRLLRAIRKPGVAKRVYRQRLAGCTPAS
jgi:hypothetical protein